MVVRCNWRVHYAVNLADLQCDFFQLTEIGESGETFRRVPVSKGDILLGDRVYAAPPGVAHVLGSDGEVIVRLNRQALPVYALGMGGSIWRLACGDCPGIPRQSIRPG